MCNNRIEDGARGMMPSGVEALRLEGEAGRPGVAFPRLSISTSISKMKRSSTHQEGSRLAGLGLDASVDSILNLTGKPGLVCIE